MTQLSLFTAAVAIAVATPAPVEPPAPAAVVAGPPTDEELAAGLDVEGFVVAGTPAAFEALAAGDADCPHCARCGAALKYVFLTSKGPMGGDCLATLTGDNSTRRLARNLSRKIDRVSHYREITGLVIEKGFHDYRICATSTNRNDYDSWSGEFGTNSDYLMSFKTEQLQLAAAVAANEAEARGLTFEPAE